MPGFKDKRLIWALRIFLVTVLAAAGTLFFEFYLKVPADSASKTFFEIKKNSGVRAVSLELEDRKLIWSRLVFEAYVWLRRADRDLRAGTYELSYGLNMKRLVDLFTTGGGREEGTITILEGWTLRDIKQYLPAQGVKGMNNFDYLAGVPAAATLGGRDWSAEFSFLKSKPRELGLEGFLFPDTYRIFKEATAEDVIRKMLENFETKFDSSLLSAAAGRKTSVFDVVTLASIVEREVQSPEDMRKVAGIFLKRLEIGMPLQADSTVNYVTGKSTPSISFADREINSPWNTYKYRGLPKGPIGNPGLSAIKAVLDPESSPYLYFLTAKDGTVIYSRTLEEHNLAKQKYLK